MSESASLESDLSEENETLTPAKGADGATGQPDAGASEAQSEAQVSAPPAEAAPPAPAPRILARRFIVPLLTLALLSVVLLTFRTVLLPFIFACIIVYLMEPIVSRMSMPVEGMRRMPRWMAVVLVYISFLAIVATSLLLIVPRFVGEIARFVETTPEVVQEFRKERLPGINSDLQIFLRSYVTLAPEVVDLDVVKAQVSHARQQAASAAAAMSSAQARVAAASQVRIQWDLVGSPGDLQRRYVGRVPNDVLLAVPADDQLVRHGVWTTEDSPETPTFRIVPDADGGFSFFLGERGVEFSAVDEDVWMLRREGSEALAFEAAASDLNVHTMFDLERGFDEVVESITTISSARISSLVEYTQSFLVGLIKVFLAVALTLMVAAFMSIDLPRIKRLCREVVPREYRESYDEIGRRLDIRLGGVVRGQLMICVVNGVLTYFGLAILGVKYSVLLAVIAAILSIIPIFGAVLSTIPIVAMALTQSFTLGMLALGWILMINFVEANILNPKIIGTAALIHPVIVIFALLAGQSAFGLVGAILAIPAASIVLTLFGFVRDKYAGTPDEDLVPGI
ncbi:MAG: AI-2E family transporter [Bradymonadaceae bacterium]|nr:AI-2E family transporter [Lujinxingiaceae bacterium]